MTSARPNRRNALGALKNRTPRIDDFYKKRFDAIRRRKFIPVFGDTIRISHIFDIDYDQDLGPNASYFDDAQETSDNGAESYEDECEDLLPLTVTEELAQLWAQEIDYPLKDDRLITRVAQFNKLVSDTPRTANDAYLDFLKRTLLVVAEDLCEMEKDEEQMAFIQELRAEPYLSFSDIVTELDFPHFDGDQEDPLSILARLPIKIYITTSYHDFIERELEAAGKQPHSRLCYWNKMGPDDVRKEHREEPDYKPDESSPLVYHLFGMEQYPESLVLSEDDCLDLLRALAEDLPGDSGERIIPPYLERELNDSSLLLLGYRLKDWDLSVLFHGLLKRGDNKRFASTAIHLDLKEQPLVRTDMDDEDRTERYRRNAELYVAKYFGQANVDVRFGASDDFVSTFWHRYLEFNQGAGAQST